MVLRFCGPRCFNLGEIVPTITHADDPRLELYVGLPDKQVRRDTALFLAEGALVVERLLESGLRLHSLLCSDRKAGAWRSRWPEDVPMFVCPEDVLRDTVGFRLHQGVIAAGYVPADRTLEDVSAPPIQGCTRGHGRDPEAPSPGPSRVEGDSSARTLVVCPEITNVDNLGLLIRIAAALGVDAMVLGERCNDPWYRRSVRLSMGTIFKLPIVRSDNIARDLRRLRDAFTFDVVGTALRDDALDLKLADRADRLAVVLGSEGYGLSEEHLGLCSRVVTIPMHAGVDSLNVAVAAGIVLHHFAPPVR